MQQPLRTHKTKIICTIGPSCEDQGLMKEMILAGMDVARLNFSHGDLPWHREMLRRLREASLSSGRHLTIIGDLPGPKIRVGRLLQEPTYLKAGEKFVLTTEEIVGNEKRCTVRLPFAPSRLRPEDRIYLNDGIICLEVEEVEGSEIRCTVITGGELRSHKGVNIPDADLGVSAFTDTDSMWLSFCLENDIDVICQSFVQAKEDLRILKTKARKLGKEVFLIAKMERSRALANMEEILEEADGVMIARGDLGVEVPIEHVPVIQKEIIRRANELGKPVITATQMLESMTQSLRPTRAEASDVANAILDGTDCVMLSAETAAGNYPLEAVKTMARIAETIERNIPEWQGARKPGLQQLSSSSPPRELLASAVNAMLEKVKPIAIFVPTRSGATARSLAKFRPSAWIVAISSSSCTVNALALSRGVHPVYEPVHPEDWRGYISHWLKTRSMPEGLVLLTEGPSRLHPDASHRVEILDLGGFMDT